MFGLSFLHPALVWGALTASVPLLLHLLRRQRFRDLLFSSLIFLSTNLRRQLRASRLTHLLLLALRMLLLLALSFAVAGPELGGTSSSGRASSVAVVLDQSASMGVTTQGVSAWDRARSLALDRIAALGPSDGLTLVTASRRPEALMIEKPGAREEAERILRQTRPTSFGGDLAAGVRDALGVLGESGRPVRRLVVISDGQEAYDPGPEAAAHGVEVERLYVSPASAANLYVAELSLPRLPSERASRRISARVSNGGSARALGSIRLNIAGAYLGERPVDVPPGASVEVRFDVTLGTEPQAGFVELTGDDLAADNLRFFMLGLDRRSPVAVIGPPSARRYVELALGVREDASRATFEVRSFERLIDATPGVGEAPSAVVLCGLDRFDAAARGALGALRQAGAGVLVFLGAETAPSLVNEALAGDATLPIRLAGRETGDWTARMQLPHHAALPSDARIGALLEQIEFRERHRFVALGQGGEPILAYSDGEPLLSELRGQSPPVLVAATSADRSFGDLALSPYFVLLVRRSTDLLCGIGSRGVLVAGADVPSGGSGRWDLVDSPADLRPRSAASSVLQGPAALLHVSSTGAADDWRAVGVDPGESRLEYPGRGNQASTGAASGPGAGRHSIAFPLALLALALFLAEGLLTARLSAQESTG
jgi:aerotolerance regulator-like protein/VWA domain-containing protein